ncbi:MAG: LPS-assembly protein LptD [Tannerella sp.]|nr:LPS-assembly protein LptD [Tannerella sp.]
MKRFLFFILLIISTGCKILNQPVEKADTASGILVTEGSEEAVHVKNDTVPLVVNTLTDSISQENIVRNDTIQTPIDSLTMLPDSAILAMTDSLTAVSDSLPADTMMRKGTLEAAVEYQSQDSIILTFAAGSIAYIYSEADVKYQNIELKSDFMRMNMDSTLLYSTYSVDSLGEEVGFPVFTDGSQELEAREMNYNFKTRKATATHVVTKQGEGFILASRTKKMANDVLNMENGHYTTCDAPEPHFYFNMTKAKVRPGKDVVTGPVWLVVEDVPLFPLVLPFAFFPFSDTYSSGILMPTYGDEMARGFSLRNGGYYFALSDYFDFALTGEIYSKGSWGLSGRSSYKKRYKYSGNFDLSYLTTVMGDKGLPDYSKSKDFKIRWSHSQDPLANPYRTVSASVDYSTSSYDRKQLNSLYTQAATQNNKGSSVNISQRFPNKPFSISATMNINQRSQDSSVSVTLPDLTFTLSRIYPFKRKNPIGKERWYEKVSMSYTGYLRNNIQTKEDKLFNSSLVKDWQNGMQHTIPISATYTLFDYINVSPSFNYTERWYTHKILQDYDFTQKRLTPTDTVYGFYRLYNYSASLSASTTVYGMFTPWKPFQKWVKVIRHRMDPSISYSMTPDFGDQKYGYYYNYVVLDGTSTPILGTNPRETSGYYSPFDRQLFGIPGRGKSGSINLSLDNNIEGKFASSRDSTGEVKVSLIDKFSGSMSYNLAADSFQWSDLSTAVRIKFGKLYTLNLNMVWDTYTWTVDEGRTAPRRVNKTRWEAGKGFGRLRSTGTAFSYTFNNDTFKKLFGGGDDGEKKNRKRRNENYPDDENDDPNDPNALQDSENEMADDNTQKKGSLLNKKKKIEGDYDEDGYFVSTIPWSLSFSYSMSLAYGDFDKEIMEYKYKINNALSFNGNIQPTKNWKINFNATYDWDAKKVSYMTCSISRTMHCFQMSASIIPIGPLKSYSFSISANASMLQDLKYDQSSTPYNGQSWY